MDHHNHGRLDLNPLLVGLLGVLAGAVIVAIVHCLIVLWCNDAPRRVASPLPRTQRQNNVDAASGSSGSFSTVQLVIAAGSSYSSECKEDMCSVCLSEFNDGDEVRVLPGCAHTFHVPCIDKWLCSHRNCPLCRAETLPSPRNLVGSLPHFAGAAPLPAPEFGASIRL